DENAQDAVVSAAQQLDVDDFHSRIGAHPLSNFPHFFYDGCPVRHVSLHLSDAPAKTGAASNKKVGFRPLRLLVPVLSIHSRCMTAGNRNDRAAKTARPHLLE